MVVASLLWGEYRAGKMDFKVEGTWNENFWILDILEWLKQWHFNLGGSLLIVPTVAGSGMILWNVMYACMQTIVRYYYQKKKNKKKGRSIYNISILEMKKWNWIEKGFTQHKLSKIHYSRFLKIVNETNNLIQIICNTLKLQQYQNRKYSQAGNSTNRS